MIFLIALVLLVSFCSAIYCIYKDNTELIFAIFIFISLCEYALLLQYISTPQAIDVYNGKTTLEITYKDSIAIDSVVVFKDKK